MLRTLSRAPRQLSFVPRRHFLKVIPQKYVGFREFLGMNRTRLDPGLSINLPIVHELHLINMQECSFRIEKQKATTLDNIPVYVGGTLFYEVKDPEKACFEVRNYKDSVLAVGTSSVRSVMGKFSYDKIISTRNTINDALVDTVGNSIKKWGVDCTRFEVQEFEPENAEVKKQLELQMHAERNRRSNELDTEARVKTSEGEKRSTIYKSEGELKAAANKAEGDLIAAQKSADGNKYNVDKETEALKNQVETLTKSFNGDAALAAKFLIEKRKLDHMIAIATGAGNKTYFFPQGADMLPNAKMIGDMLVSQTAATGQSLEVPKKVIDA
jgi:regulator of protease activity HflC (stomatin/prohibitin superfamily)